MASSAFSSSLFGGAKNPGPSSAPQQTASIFSSANPTSAFGNASTSQTPSFSVLGQPSQQQQQQPQQSQQMGQSQQPNLTQSMSASQATQPAYFNSLLERGKKRPFAQDAGFGELPSLQLGLDDIRRKARELGSAGVKSSPQAGRDSKA
jgi:nuclear pore complex protein Nup93